MVRTQAEPGAVAGELRTELASLDHNLPLANLMTMRERMGESVGEQRFRTLLLGSFAGVRTRASLPRAVCGDVVFRQPTHA